MAHKCKDTLIAVPELRIKLTGHKTEAVHRSYIHHELEELRAAVEKMPALNSK